MDFTEFASGNVQGRGTGGVFPVAHGNDQGLIVTFYMESVRQGAASEKAGRPIFKDVPYIWIRFPGDKTRDIKRKVDMTGARSGIPDPERFPRQWAAFQNQQEEVHEGTPIEEWGPISKSLALTYKGINIHTVEQLASVPDSALHSMGHGSRQMRDKAVAWLESAEGSSEVMRLKTENQQLRDDLEALKEQVSELATKKRGRPRKEA